MERIGMDSELRIVIADDHPIFREGLVKSIGKNKNFSIVAEADNGAEALEKIRTLRPDIAVLDVEMPMMSGIDVARVIYKEALPTDIIFLTMHNEAAYFNAALDLGVRGYLLKNSVVGELVQCLTSVAEGEYFISHAISHFLLERKKKNASLLQTVPGLNHLTPAERSILKHLADNLTSKEIAEKLFVSSRTVENHRLHICQKLEIKGHNRLLQFALEHKNEL
jgi:DNA-binding NarL/FixJ family response regulator